MYNGIGLQTARGSGTNGYVQTNKFFVKSKTTKVLVDSSKGFGHDQGTAGISRKPNRDILEHDRKRQIELKLTILEDKLTDQGYTDAEIAEKLENTRRTLEAADAAAASDGGAVPVPVSDKNISDTQTHQIAARKEKKMEQLRAALGLDDPDAKKQVKMLDEGEGERRNNGVDDEYEEGEILHGQEDISLPALDDQIRYGNPDKGSVKGAKADNHGGLSRKEKGKKKRHNQSSSDTDSESKDETTSDVDIKRKQRTLKRSRKSSYEDSDGSSFDSGGSDEGHKKRVHKRPNRQKEQARSKKGDERKKRHDESSDTETEHTSESESDSYVKAKLKRKLSEKSKKGKYGDNGSESDRDGNSEKVYARRGTDNYPEGRRRHDSDSDSDHRGHLSRKKDKNAEARGRHDSDDDSDRGYQQRAIHRYPVARRRHNSDSDSDLDGHFNYKNDKYVEVHRSHDYESDSDENGPVSHRKDVRQRERKRTDDSDVDEVYHSDGRRTESDIKDLDYKNNEEDKNISSRLDVDDGFKADKGIKMRDRSQERSERHGRYGRDADEGIKSKDRLQERSKRHGRYYIDADEGIELKDRLQERSERHGRYERDADEGSKLRDRPQERSEKHGRCDRDADRKGSDFGEKVDMGRRSKRHDSDLDGYDKKHPGRDSNDVKPEDKHYRSRDGCYVDRKDRGKNHSKEEEPKNEKGSKEGEDYVDSWRSNEDHRRKRDIDEEERHKDMDQASKKRTSEAYGDRVEKTRDRRDEVQPWRRHDRADEDRKHIKDEGEMNGSRKRSGRDEAYGSSRHERDADSCKRSRHDDSRPSERRKEGSRYSDDRRRR